jgi:outer membrane biosynthesis protein TonB
MRPQRALTVPLSASLLLHVAIIGAFLFLKPAQHVSMPVYRVTLVAAPAGERAAGVVDAPKPAANKPVPPRPREAPPKASTKRTPASVKPTTTAPPPTTPVKRTPEAPKAGGGATGGKGTDLLDLDLDGREFPFPTYLTNIVNQIRKYFTWTGSQAYRADVQFFIRRDGSVADIRTLASNTSASYEFKKMAEGAIEAAGKMHGFGPLPEGFADDVLPVTFSFDPRIFKK